MQAIKRLKRRFIALAMVSLTILLAFIVTGMNIMNYNDVVSDADARLDVLEQNSDRLLNPRMTPRDFKGPGPLNNPADEADADNNSAGMNGKSTEDFFYGKGGERGPFMTRDEAEESRFFIVTTDENGAVKKSNTDRIASVDEEGAKEYAEKALASGKDKGFVDEIRYSVDDNGSETVITFLDCGRVLESFRDYLKASIKMSVAGLLAVFGIITFFAGRIIKPVAESYEKQKRFITDAGHEIKTPLAIIKANLDVIKMDPDSTEESLQDIDEQVDRLAGLTNDLVYLSRMEEAEESLVMSDVPLSDIVNETASSFEALAKDKGKAIELDIEPMLSINGSTKEIEKLVSILLENAVKYSDESEPIKVSLKKDGRNCTLEVSNRTAEEVSNESLAHVFERFYRTDESRNSATGGHGIGLSMASAIVSAHKGKISARTTDGHDFTVSAVLPQ